MFIRRCNSSNNQIDNGVKMKINIVYVDDEIEYRYLHIEPKVRNEILLCMDLIRSIRLKSVKMMTIQVLGVISMAIQLYLLMTLEIA